MEAQKKSVKIQYLAALVVSPLGLLYGIMTAWSSPSILLLTSDASPLPSGKVTMEEAAWIASLKSLGFFIGSTMCGIISNKYGRKWPMIMLSIPSIISWCLIWFAQNIYYIHVARLLHGFITAGVFSLCQFYFVEIANDDIRGALGSIPMVSGSIGMPVAMALGAYASYEVTPIFSIALSVLFAIIFFFFPETPLFLVKQNQISQAEKSIKFYQNTRDCATIQAEIERLKSLVGAAEAKKLEEKATEWSEVLRNPGRKALVIGVFLAALENFSGSFALLNYTATIFDESGSVMSSNESALFVSIIQFVGAIIMPFLVDRTGRKALYIISTAGSILGFIVLGLYMMFKSFGYSTEEITWIPIVTFSFIVLVQSLAIATLLFAVSVEVMPENLKEFGISLCNMVAGITGFLILQFMPLLTDSFGFYGTMYLFAGVCAVSLIFIIIYIPETKGKSYEEIMEILK